ncbi:MAG: class I SAM-dependent methyltransferase [Candidatus Omnitrophica bacterium]|nr:class I SAM-dependent methyltransferase [Candidatus Omnitrophota bacterium]
MKILDVGCSKNKVQGAVGLDIDPNSDADILCDLTKRLPIEDKEYDLIYCKHLLEHLERPDDVIHLVGEIFRVCKPGGRVVLEVPHFSSYIAYADVTHRRYFSWFMLNGLLNKLPHETVKKELKFYKVYRAIGVKFLANRFVEAYERFWTYLFPAETLWFEIIKK